MVLDLAEDDAAVPVRVEAPEEQEDAEDEAEVADAVDDEGLVAGGRVRLLPAPEADQRVRAEPDALPADEHQQQVVAEHQHQHREREEVEVREEAPVRVVLVHVADRVQVDQAADAGDDQDHGAGERVDLEGDVGVQGADVDPARHAVEQEALRRAAGRGAEGTPTTERPNATNTGVTASALMAGLPKRRWMVAPARPLTTAPISGSSGIQRR